MSTPQSDAFSIKAYLAETPEAFCDGHVAAFASFGGVPASILYDNTTIAVAMILGDGTRKRTRIFSELQSHDLFEGRFGRPGKGNDKGNVEGVIGFGRRNFLVPMPRFESFEVLNDEPLSAIGPRTMASGLFEGASDIFERGGQKKAEVEEEMVRSLHARIGELAVANDFLSRKLKPWTGR